MAKKKKRNAGGKALDSALKKIQRPRAKSKNSSRPADSRGTSVAKKKKSAARSGRARMRAGVVAAALALAAIASVCLLDVSRVTTNAMMPTLARNDLVISWAPVWGAGDCEPGSIVLIDAEDGEAAPNYLRLIANRNEEVSYQSDRIAVDGVPISRMPLTNDAIVRPEDEPEIYRETLKNGAAYKIMLPQRAILGKMSGCVNADNGAFLAGDNRMASYDSRQNGLYGNDRLRGRALFVLESARNDGVIASWFKMID